MHTILAFGDSLTAGFGVAPQNSFASLLERSLEQEGYEARVINGGVSGDTTIDALPRLSGLLRYEPDVVLIELGANDFAMWVPLETVRSHLERMIQSAQDVGARVILAGVRSLSGADREYTESFHAMYKELARAYGLELVPDFLPDIPGNPELTLPDGLHPNETGIQRIVDQVLPYLRPILSPQVGQG